MVKKVLIVCVTLLITGSIVYTSAPAFSYENSAKLLDFPVPIGAEEVQNRLTSSTFSWTSVTSDEGIPLSYKLRIELDGWKEISHDSGSTLYKKGGKVIELTTARHYLLISLYHTNAQK